MSHKTLMRSKTDAKIAGICGGLGEYFDVDSNIFRILFVLMLLFGSLGLWFYLACWIILPVNNALPSGNDNNNYNSYNG